ncbi:MAG: NINE protein [Actinomycetota bacterium]
MTTAPTEPGWLDDPQGRRRWWTGTHWGAYAPWDDGSAPRVVRSSTSSVRLDRRYLLDPTAPVSRTAPRLDPVPAKRLRVAYALLVLLGALGAHRFYVGRHGSAAAMLALTAAGSALLLLAGTRIPLLAQLESIVPLAWLGAGVLALVALWWLVDLFRTATLVRTANRRALRPPAPRAYDRGWPAP